MPDQSSRSASAIATQAAGVSTSTGNPFTASGVISESRWRRNSHSCEQPNLVFVVAGVAGRVGREAKLGQLLVEHELAHPRLRQQHIAKRHAVVEHAEDELKRAILGRAFAQEQRQLAVLIADDAPLAERIFPGRVFAAAGRAGELDVGAERRAFVQLEAEPRIFDDRLAVDASPI